MSHDNVRRQGRRLRLMDASGAIPIFGDLQLVPGLAEFLADPEACFQVAALLKLAAGATRPGADVRDEAYRIAAHPAVHDWLDESEAFLERSKTSPDLRRKQRHGILRVRSGSEEGFPLGFSCAPVVREGITAALGCLVDEREYYLLHVYEPTRMRPYPVPVKHIINSTDARALLGWSWYRLEKFLRRNPHLPTGRVNPPGSSGIAFVATQFAKWAWSDSM